eukprot:1823108-Pyramimonas_sp.AAC.1
MPARLSRAPQGLPRPGQGLRRLSKAYQALAGPGRAQQSSAGLEASQGTAGLSKACQLGCATLGKAEHGLAWLSA